MSRGRSGSPLQSRDVEMDVDNHIPEHKSDLKVIIVNNLTRNVVESHLKIIFSFYGEVVKIDLPLYGKCGLHVFVLLKLKTNKNESHSWSKPRQGGT